MGNDPWGNFVGEGLGSSHPVPRIDHPIEKPLVVEN